MLGAFLGDKPAVNLDEQMLAAFVADLAAKDGGREKYWREFSGDIRGLVNSLPDGLRRRPMLTPTQADTAGRLSRLTPETQDAIRRFLRDGRKVRTGSSQPLAAMEPLTDSTKGNAVSTALTILNALQANDLRALTDDTLDTFRDLYAGQGKETPALGYFADVGCLFRNLAAWGFISEVPNHMKVRKPKRVNRDYVTAEGIARLQDLNTLDWDDFQDVRDRMISLVLLYDFCLRQGEAIRLDQSDVRLGKYVEVSLRGVIQKGNGKDDVLLCSCLDESMRLVSRYLQMRQDRRPRSESLLVATDGDRLMEAGCVQAVKGQCLKLGIRTFRGMAPSCHRLRHAFGTLNIEPLGQGRSPGRTCCRPRRGTSGSPKMRRSVCWTTTALGSRPLPFGKASLVRRIDVRNEQRKRGIEN